MAATLLTLTNGREIQVALTYEDAKAYLGTKGREREVTTTCGRKLTLPTDLIAITEEVREVEKRAVGFR